MLLLILTLFMSPHLVCLALIIDTEWLQYGASLLQPNYLELPDRKLALFVFGPIVTALFPCSGRTNYLWKLILFKLAADG